MLNPFAIKRLSSSTFNLVTKDTEERRQSIYVSSILTLDQKDQSSGIPGPCDQRESLEYGRLTLSGRELD